LIAAADTSVLIAYLAGAQGRAVETVTDLIDDEGLRLPPVVITELMSHPLKGPLTVDFIVRSPILGLREGYWSRAGETRRTILARGLKARLSDTLIAQCCIDADVPLITLDSDFRHFAAHCGLKLA
jgi:predicted nucleic acid-binding protein